MNKTEIWCKIIQYFKSDVYSFQINAVQIQLMKLSIM